MPGSFLLFSVTVPRSRLRFSALARRYVASLRHCFVTMAAAVSSWSAEDAVDYLVRVSGVARSKAELDVRRIITFPGQAAAPQYGHLKLNMLRRLAQSAIGIIRLSLFTCHRAKSQSLKTVSICSWQGFTQCSVFHRNRQTTQKWRFPPGSSFCRPKSHGQQAGQPGWLTCHYQPS